LQVKKAYAGQIKDRDIVNDSFLVREKITAMARNGKPYLTIKLMDRTGEVDGRVWDRVEEISGCFEKNDFVQVQGKASLYLGKMQLVIQNLKKVDDSQVDLADYLPVAERSTEDMLAELHAQVASLQTPCLRELMNLFMADENFMRGYTSAPAAKAIHHVYLGGLLDHSLAVGRLVDDVCRHYPAVNRDLLLTGALLHDIGKVAELCYERAFGYTDEGKLLGHITIGFQMLDGKLAQLPDFPSDLAVLLKHLLLSHHGQYEFGSPKRPKTLEATILNYLDDLDSKINGIQTHIEKEPDNEEPWTGYHRIYDRYFYKSSQAGAGRESESTVPPSTSKASLASAPEAEKASQTTGAKQRRQPGERRKGFNFTLGDQLRGKNLDLFTADEREDS
jgi:3'-5' exoribonuclease